MAGAVPLGQKVGPLPVGVWIAVVVGGLGIGYWMNRNQGDELATPPVQDPGVGVGGSGWEVVPQPPPPVAAQETNMTWAFKATNWLISQLHPPTVAANAISKFIYGMQLTVQENALVNLALKQFGPPPEPLPPVDPPVIDPPDDPPNPPNPPRPNPPTTDQPPPPITGLRAESPTRTSIMLLWSPSPGATHYQMDGLAGAFHSVISYDTNITVQWLEPGRAYTFKIRAMRGNAGSAYREITASAGGGGEYRAGPQGPRTHIVRAGDTLHDIAVRCYGNARKKRSLFAANQAVLDAAARARGYENSDQGNRLFVGTVLTLA